MTAGTIQHVIEDLDKILEDDKNLNTRTGLRFAFSLVRESFELIDDFKKEQERLVERVRIIETERATEKKQADERKKADQWLFRTTVGAALAAVVLFIVNGVLYLLTTLPLIQRVLEAAKP